MKLFGTLIVCALVVSGSFAYDPSPLQDVCVATTEQKDTVFVNGKFCKSINLTTPEDFLFQGLDIPGDTNNRLNSKVNLIYVDGFPGLNTIGMSLARIDFGPNGLNSPHFHPRASELLLVLKGTLYVGFVTTNQSGNKFFSKVLKKGDLFVFPFGMIHFQLNVGKGNAVAIAALSSQNPGVMTISNALFGSTPSINDSVLTKAFQLEEKIIDYLQSQF